MERPGRSSVLQKTAHATCFWERQRKGESMKEERQHRKLIIAGVDGSEATDDVIRNAVAIARGFPGGEIHYVFIAEPPLYEATDFSVEPIVLEGKKLLGEVMSRTSATFDGRVETHLAVGLATESILELASELKADVIVVGARGKGYLSRTVLGSVSRAIFSHARCTVLVARDVSYRRAEWRLPTARME